MISAALGHDDPAHAVCSRALLFVWSVTTGAQASMTWIALVAYRVSLVTYQASASVYAAIASSRSSVHP